MGKAMLGMLSLLLVLMVFEGTARDEGEKITQSFLSALLLTGPLLFCALGNIFCMPEFWAGIFLALSISAYGL